MKRLRSSDDDCPMRPRVDLKYYIQAIAIDTSLPPVTAGGFDVCVYARTASQRPWQPPTHTHTHLFANNTQIPPLFPCCAVTTQFLYTVSEKMSSSRAHRPLSRCRTTANNNGNCFGTQRRPPSTASMAAYGRATSGGVGRIVPPFSIASMQKNTRVQAAPTKSERAQLGQSK